MRSEYVQHMHMALVPSPGNAGFQPFHVGKMAPTSYPWIQQVEFDMHFDTGCFRISPKHMKLPDDAKGDKDKIIRFYRREVCAWSQLITDYKMTERMQVQAGDDNLPPLPDSWDVDMHNINNWPVICWVQRPSRRR